MTNTATATNTVAAPVKVKAARKPAAKKAAKVLATAPAVSNAYVNGEPETNYIAVDMNGNVLPVGSAMSVRPESKNALKVPQYGATFDRDDLFVATSVNTKDQVARALASIRSRFQNAPPKVGCFRHLVTTLNAAGAYKTQVTAWVPVPVKGDRKPNA